MKNKTINSTMIKISKKEISHLFNKNKLMERNKPLLFFNCQVCNETKQTKNKAIICSSCYTQMIKEFKKKSKELV